MALEMFDTFYFHVTQKCNLQCEFCYFNAGSPMPNELSTDEIVEVLKDVSLLKPRRIVFTGGEPLLRKDLIHIGRALKNIGMKIHSCLQTNGMLINEENALSLVEYFDEIRISIDGLEAINDSLRGIGTFQKVMDAFWFVRKAGGDPRAFITVSSVNLPHLKELMHFLFCNGIVKIHLSPLKLIGKVSDKSLLCDNEELKRIVAEFWYEAVGLHLVSERKGTFNCGVGKFLTVYPDGSIYPCHLLAYPEFCLGNVRNTRLSKIYHQSKLMNKLKDLDFMELAHCMECFKELSPEIKCLGNIIQEKNFRKSLLDL